MPAEHLLDLLEPNYSDEQKRLAAVYVVMAGDYLLASQQSGIPEDVLTSWKRKPWWKEILSEIRADKKEEFDALSTSIIHKAADALLDRIEHGDTVIDKLGVPTQVPLSARDLAYITGTYYDRRAASRGEAAPTRSAQDGVLQVLAEKLLALGRAARDASPPPPGNIYVLPSAPLPSTTTGAINGGAGNSAEDNRGSRQGD